MASSNRGMVETRKKYYKRGGTLKKERILHSLTEGEPLDMYYPYLEILQSIMKQGYTVETKDENDELKTEFCVKGDPVEKAVEYGGRGKETLNIIFKCNQNISLSIKAYVNYDFSKTNDNYDSYRVKMLNPNIWGPVKEFNSIKKFDSPYIIKAYKYFFFNGKSCELSSIVPPKISTDITLIDVIGTPEPKITDEEATTKGWKMKHPTRTRGLPNQQIPWFSGIILSHAQYSLDKDLQKHYTKIDDILGLYKQYLLGVKEINNRGYIHRNLHWDNLRYNYNPTNRKFTAQIIHIHKIYNIDKANKIVNFKAAREAITPLKDAAFLERATANMTDKPDLEKGQKFLTDNDKQILCIRHNYDLYGLSTSFLHVIRNFENKTKNISETTRMNMFKKILELATDQNFLTRINTDEALSKINEIYTH